MSEKYCPDLFWFDGDWEHTGEDWRMKELRDELHSYNPKVILNSRMKGYGDYKTPEQGLPVKRPEGPWEMCMTLNDHWGYFDKDTNYKTLSQVIRIFTDIIAMGGRLLLDIGPMADGTIPPEQVELLKGLGKWIRENNDAVSGCSTGLPRDNFAGNSTISNDNKTIYIFMYDKPVNHLMVKGIRNKIKKISAFGDDRELSHKIFGGAPWQNIPGSLWIDVPMDLEIGYCRVLKLELEGELDLFRGEGGAIEQN